MDGVSLHQGPTQSQIKKVKELVLVVARCFYTEEYIVIMDALTRQKNIVKDEDLASLLKLHQRQVRKVLNELEKDKLVKKEDRKEQKEKTYAHERNSQVAHTYWYIDYKHFIDVVRFRIHLLHGEVKNEMDRSASMDLKCTDSCGKTYSMLYMDKLLNPNTGNFHCTCGRVLTQHSSSAEQYNQENPVVKQIKAISDLLKATKDMPLPVVSKIPATPQSLGLASTPTVGAVPTPSTGKASVTVQAPKVIVQIAASTPSSLTDIGARMQGINNPPRKELPKKKELPIWYQNKEVEEAKAKAKAKQNEELAIDPAYEENPDPDVYKKFYEDYLKAMREQIKKQGAATPAVPAAPAQPEPVAEPAQAEPKATEEEEEFEEEEEEMVMVAGKPVRTSEITQDHIDQMTETEYKDYYGAVPDVIF